MGSLNAKAVAAEIVSTLRKGAKVNKGRIIRKHGYTKRMSEHPAKILGTKAAKEIIDPVIKAMMAERDAIMARLPKMRNKAKYRDLVDGADKMTKNIQLLNGGKTSNDAMEISWS